MNTDKAIVVIGPTASGKSDLAIKLALEKNGEVISVDSRQVYRGMNLGTGKVDRDQLYPELVEGSLFEGRDLAKSILYFSEGIRHHLLDICNPGESYNVTDFLRDAKMAETDIRARGKVPIFCGGTLFWMKSYIYKTSFPEVPPNESLRKKLEEKSAEELFTELTKKDLERTKTIDPKNKMRLIRALEIIDTLGKVPALSEKKLPEEQDYEIIILDPSRDELRERIQKRLTARIEGGMVDEVEHLLTQDITHEWLQGIGLEYKYISFYLQKKLSLEEMEEQLFFAIWHYAKRQITFLKRF
jgi:tRNA dimethylallyltransferase